RSARASVRHSLEDLSHAIGKSVGRRMAATMRPAGRRNMGELIDAREWVSASKTRNYLNGEPLLDWLHLLGPHRGFVPDHELPGYDPRTDFTQFIFGKGHEFEAAVMR